MSEIAFFGAVELGLIYGIVAFGVFLTFRVLDFPDLTVESSFPLGGAIAAACIVSGWEPWTATAFAVIGGCFAGYITAFLAVHCGILSLLAGILTMIAGFSINIRIMGRPNISLLGEDSIFSVSNIWDVDEIIFRPLLLIVLIVLITALLNRFLFSEVGLAMRATGVNMRMLRAQGGNPGFYSYLGLGLSNGLVALGGALFSQSAGFADITTGVGTIIYGLAAVILGQTLLHGSSILVMLLACLLGSFLYRLAVAFALSNEIFGLQASDLNLVTAILVALALIIPRLRSSMALRRKR